MPNPQRRNARVKNKRYSQDRRSLEKTGINNIEIIYGNLLSEFKNMSLYRQVMSCYFIFLVIFITIIIFFKFQNTSTVLEMQTNVNYYSSVVIDLLNQEKDLKMNLDILNNNDYICQYYTHLFFYRIYTMELANHNFADLEYNPNITNIPISRDSLNVDINTIYSEFNQIDNLDFNLRRMNLANEVIIPSEDNKDEINPNNFVTIIYTMTPLFYQNLKMNGINLLNYYFLGFGYNDKSCNTKIKNSYFKYPIEYSEISPTLSNENIFDSTLDPIGVCSLNNVKNIDVEKVKKTNWYYNYENKFLNETQNLNKNSDSRLITLLKLGLNYDRQEYHVNYQTFSIKSKSGKNYYFTFAQKINRLTSSIPFLSTDHLGEKPYDYFSIINFHNPDSNYYKYVDINESDNVFLKDYNIDDKANLVINIPKFIDHIYKYTMLPRGYIDQVNNININSLLLSNSEMKKIWENYYINYYFDIDSNIFDLILFLNNFLMYNEYEKRMISENTIINENSTLIESFNTEQFHRCYTRNLTEWYSYVYSSVKKYSYNCLDDYCFFNNCTTDHKYYKNPSSKKYLPNCYCLPMYCRDPLTYTDDYSIPLEFRELNRSVFYNKTTNFLNMDKSTIKCRLSFYQKQKDISPYNYQTVINLKKPNFRYNTTMFIMYLMEETTTDSEVILKLQNGVYLVKVLVFLIYTVFMFFIFCTFIKCMSIKLVSLKDRIDKVKLIIKMILKISEHLEVNDNESQHNNLLPNNSDDLEIEELDEDKLNDEDFENKEDFMTNVKNNEDINIEMVNRNNIEEDNENLSEENNENIYDFNNLKNKEENILNRVEKELMSLGIRMKKDQQNNQHQDRYSDELQQLIFIIVDNLNEFKIEFNINTNMYEIGHKLNKQFVDIIKSKYYEDRIIPKDRIRTSNINTLTNLNSSEDDVRSENGTVYSNSSWEDLESNLSLNIIYEILSTEEMVDLSQIRSNFNFKDAQENSIFSFYDCINQILYDESNYTNELTDPDKLKTAINYYMYEIHLKWSDQYDKRKNIYEN